MTIRRKVFFSFHYKPDNWRAAGVRSMGIVEGNPPASDNDWESVTRGGDATIRNWIGGQMHGKSCSIVLIGSQTAGRKWINYEVEKAWSASTSITSKTKMETSRRKAKILSLGSLSAKRNFQT